jgi:hypothetical protein
MIQVERLRLHFLFPLIWATALAAALVPRCIPQAVAVAQVSGQVTDPSDAAVPDAIVTITEAETGYSRTTKSDSQGLYSFPTCRLGLTCSTLPRRNHTSFNLAKTSTVGVTDIDAVTSPIFGRLTSAKDPRILQLALKMYF